MRRSVAVLGLVLGTLTTACGLAAPGRAPEPTATPFKPANLLTPRPVTPTPVAQPTARAALSGNGVSGANTATPRASSSAAQSRTPVPTPTATAEPTPRGTPVEATEPLVGSLLDDSVLSPIIGESFPYRVYLPPDYQHSAKRYPVLYMLHGVGGNYTEWSDSYLPEQTDRMIAAGDIPPLIVVMPDDGGSSYWVNWAEGGPRWADYVAEDVVSTIDQRYRTLPSGASRAIGGLSMGGLGALNLAFQHPDVFGVVGGHSPSVRLEPDPALWFMPGQAFWDNNPVWLAQHRTGLDRLKIWLDAGTDDVWLPNIESMHTTFVEEGLQVEWHNFPGPHEAEYWIEHVPDYLRFYGSKLRS